MYVPCNMCCECLAKRQADLVQRCRNEALSNYIFMCTLTYNDSSLPRLVTSNGYEISYADIGDLQKMVKRIRKGNFFGRPFHYLFVSERGSTRGRPHFHGLLFIQKSIHDDKLFPAQMEGTVRSVLFKEWRRNYGSTRNPLYRPLFTYRTKYVGGVRYSNFDVHYVAPHLTANGSDDVAFYVTKYLLKPSDKESRLQQALRLNLSDDEYNAIWNVVKSKALFSKGFGAHDDLQIAKIKACISKSKSDSDGLKFYTANGMPQPLARYYRKFVTADDAISSVTASGGPIKFDERTDSDRQRSIMKGNVIREKVSNRDLSPYFTDNG